MGLASIVALSAGCQPSSSWLDWFATPDQQGQWLARHGRLAEAAEHFRDPLRQGIAWYRVGEFDRAATAFGQVDTAAGWYNRGDALVMLGKYQDAVASYDKALALRPEWREAVDNRALALARGEALGPSPDEQDEAAGIDPDAIVVGDRKLNSGENTEVADAQGSVSDSELRALWLRRVQTTPQDFLRAKFAYQTSKGAAPP